MQLDDLYRRVIMDHYKNPRNRGTFEDDAVTIDLNNPTCGDRISLQLKVEDGIVEAGEVHRRRLLDQHVLRLDDDGSGQRQDVGGSACRWPTNSQRLMQGRDR